MVGTIPANQVQFTSPSFFQIKTASTPGGLRVEGRELIFTLKLPNGYSGGYSAGYQTIYPGMSPRIVNFGKNYEFYRFHRISAIFQPNLSNVNGVLALAVDADYRDAVPADMVALCRNASTSMDESTKTNSTTVTDSYFREGRYFVESPSAEQTLLYQGNIIYGYEGLTPSNGQTIPANATVGYLYVAYDIEFYTPC